MNLPFQNACVESTNHNKLAANLFEWIIIIYFSNDNIQLISCARNGYVIKFPWRKIDFIVLNASMPELGFAVSYDCECLCEHSCDFTQKNDLYPKKRETLSLSTSASSFEQLYLYTKSLLSSSS